MANNDITMLDLPPATALSGAEQAWIVQGGTDRRVAIGLIAGLPASAALVTTVVQSGSTYDALPTDELIIVQKSVASPTNIDLPLSSEKIGFYWIKDGNGNASPTDPINAVADGELIDGFASVPIQTPYGALQIAPNPLGGWVIINFG